MSDRPRGDRTSEAEMEQRIRKVQRFIIRGTGYSDLVALCDGEFGVCQRTAERYIAEANQRIRVANDKDRDLEIAKAKARYEEFIRIALSREELTPAITAQRDLVKLLGLAEPERIEHEAGDTLTLFFKQLRAGEARTTDRSALAAVEPLQN